MCDSHGLYWREDSPNIIHVFSGDWEARIEKKNSEYVAELFLCGELKLQRFSTSLLDIGCTSKFLHFKMNDSVFFIPIVEKGTSP